MTCVCYCWLDVDLHLPLILQGDILLLNCTYRTQNRRTGVTLVSPDISNMFKDTCYYVSTILTLNNKALCQIWYFLCHIAGNCLWVQTFNLFMDQPASVGKKWTRVEIDDVIILAVNMHVSIQIVWWEDSLQSSKWQLLNRISLLLYIGVWSERWTFDSWNKTPQFSPGRFGGISVWSLHYWDFPTIRCGLKLHTLLS